MKRVFPPHRLLSVGVLAAAMVWLALATGCAGNDIPAPGPLPGPSPMPPLTAAASTSVVTSTNEIMALTWWTPEFISPGAQQPGGAILQEYITDFELSHGSKVRITPVIKAKYGKGGLLDYLRTAQPVAPSVLPDFVTIDLAEVGQAAALGALRPLDGLIDDESMARLYPFAQTSGHIDGQLIALPFAADVEQLVFDPERVQTPPNTWVGLMTRNLAYLFPAGNPGAPLAVQPGILSQYLSAGGKIDPETRELVLEEGPLLRLLTFYHEAQLAGSFPSNIFEVTSPDETWNAYTQGSVPMANVSARHYLVARDSLPKTDFAAPPGWSGPVILVSSGWGLAIVTPDPERQKVAAEFIAGLLTPNRAGQWARAAGWLPTSPEALATWGASPYVDFLDTELAGAISGPAGADSSAAASRLQQAALDVLRGERSPDEALKAALNPAK